MKVKSTENFENSQHIFKSTDAVVLYDCGVIMLTQYDSFVEKYFKQYNVNETARLAVLGSISGQVQSYVVLLTARHRCDDSSELCCSNAMP